MQLIQHKMTKHGTRKINMCHTIVLEVVCSIVVWHTINGLEDLYLFAITESKLLCFFALIFYKTENKNQFTAINNGMGTNLYATKFIWYTMSYVHHQFHLNLSPVYYQVTVCWWFYSVEKFKVEYCYCCCCWT